MRMKVALIDPSLFTLPYDLGLMGGLRGIGIDAALHGRAPVPQDGGPDDADVVKSFYGLSGLYQGLPVPLRLLLKGLDHGISLVRLRKRLQLEKPDIIHFQWLPLPLLDGAMLRQFKRIAPVILTVHDTDPFNGDPTARVQRIGFSTALKSCDHLIVHTNQGRDRLTSYGVAAARVSVLPHGPLGEAGSNSGTDNPSDKITFVLFGKIKPYKGADLLIKAFAAMPASIRERAQVRIVGQSYMDTTPLQQLVKMSGLTDFVRIEDRFICDVEIPVIFGPNVVAVFPYREIEASGVLSLALTHSRPIIASKLGLFAEALIDGVHGRLVPPEDCMALSGAMAEMIEDRDFTAHCARNVAGLASSLPAWTEIAELTASLYAVSQRQRAMGQPHKHIELSKEFVA